MITEERRQEALAALEILDTAPEDRFDRITRLAQRFFEVPMVSVTLLDGERQWRKSHRGLTTEAPRESAFCDLTARQDAPLVIDDAAADDRFRDNPFVVGDPHLRFYAGEPLRAAGGEPVGTLCVLDTVPHSLNAEQLQLLRDLADWVQAELDRDAQSDGVAVVQTALLPRRKPAARGFEIAAASEAGAAVSGDFYDWYDDGDGFCVTVGDVVGRGMSAAIVAASVRAALRSATPYAGLERAIETVSANLEDDLGRLGVLATAFHARIAPSGTVEYVDAGNGLAFVVEAAGGVRRLEPGLAALPERRGAGRARRRARSAARGGDRARFGDPRRRRLAHRQRGARGRPAQRGPRDRGSARILTPSPGLDASGRAWQAAREGAAHSCAQDQWGARVMTDENAATSEGLVRSGGRVIVGVDGSASSVEALRRGAGIAERYGATLAGVTAWSYPDAWHGYVGADWSPEQDAHEIAAETAQQVFGDALPSWYAPEIVHGSPAFVLIEATKTADLVIVGNRGRGGFAGLLLGSVSRSIAERAHCPVLIIRGAESPAA